MPITLPTKSLLLIAAALALGVAGTSASATETDSTPTVLRGSRPEPQVLLPVPVPAEQPVCPTGSVEEPGYGCVSSGYAAESDGYAPYLGQDAGFVDVQHHKLHHLGMHSIFRAAHSTAHVGMTNHR